jgi:hypothetical protein
MGDEEAWAQTKKAKTDVSQEELGELGSGLDWDEGQADEDRGVPLDKAGV